MKNPSNWIYLLLISGLLACGNPDKETVNKLADRYLKARIKGDFATAALLISPESRENLAELEALSTEFLEEEQTEYKFAIQSLDIKGDSAEVHYQIEGQGIEALHLLKQAAEWKISLSDLEVPDAFILYQDLLGLESLDTITAEQAELDAMLLNEELDEDGLLDSLIREDEPQ